MEAPLFPRTSFTPLVITCSQITLIYTLHMHNIQTVTRTSLIIIDSLLIVVIVATKVVI